MFAVQITLNSTWVIVNTFKANQYELPLYDGMCPNIFLMLCFQDYQKGHEAIVFRLTLTVVFWENGTYLTHRIPIEYIILLHIFPIMTWQWGH